MKSSSESARVRAFLFDVQSRIASLERRLDVTGTRLAASEQELAQTRQALAERSAELARLRQEYEGELARRGEEAAAMAAEFLNEKFGATLAAMRAEVAAQYEARITNGESTLAEKEVSLARLGDMVDVLRGELAEVKARAAEESETLRRQQATERESLCRTYEEARTAAVTQLEERTRELEATVAEKEQLFVRANDLVAALQREVTRVQAAASAEAAALREGSAADRAQLEGQLVALEEKLARANAQVKELERIVAHSEDLQLIKALEREKTELTDALASREQREKALASALTVLREICAKSQAARSIIAGARKDVDLTELFAVLDSES